MNKSSLKSILLKHRLIFLFVTATLFAHSQTINITNGTTAFRVINHTEDHLSVENTLAAIRSLTVNTRHGNFTELMIPEYGTMTEPGSPKLPVMKKLIEVPYGCDYDIRITNVSTETIRLSEHGITNRLFPFQPSVSKSIKDPQDLPFQYNESIYRNNAFFGQEAVQIVDLGILRGIRMARLEIAPVRYNPVTGELKVITNITCEIAFTGADLQLTHAEKIKGFSPWFEANFKQLINHTPAGARALIDAEPVTYIIVADPMFEAALQPFIQWKAKKGFKVVEAYTDDPAVGTTTTSIKNYLQNFYNNPPQGYNPQSFVLFVGDVAQIPAFSGTTGGHVTDLYYCEYTGDIYPEAYYGRFSAVNLAQLQPQIEKTLEYEQYTFPDPSFLDEVVMVAGADGTHQLTWGNGQINYGTTYYFNAAHGLTSHTYLQPEPAGGNYSANIRQNVSNGAAYANYTAHCSTSGWSNPSFTINHIPALSNKHKYPLMVGNCCHSASFQYNSFGEAIVQAADKGAVGYIGGTNSTYWDEDFWWGVGYETVSANPVYHSQNLGAYDRTFHDGTGITTQDWFVTQGQMPSAGNLAVTQAGSYRETYYWEIYHLMGDPSLMIYYSQPPDIGVSYEKEIIVGEESFTLNTDPYAYVAISKDGTLHGAALADVNGNAVVSIAPFNEPGIADLVVTKQNGKPFIGTVNIIQTQTQIIDLPAGWSGLSSNLIPENTDIETLFQEVIDNIVILQNPSGVYYPETGINTLGQWDNHKGYEIKTTGEVTLTITGWEETTHEINLKTGWNLIPVLSDCEVSVSELLQNVSGDVVMVKEVAGNGIYWPSKNILTLESLVPGKAYFVRTTQGVRITYPECP